MEEGGGRREEGGGRREEGGGRMWMWMWGLPDPIPQRREHKTSGVILKARLRLDAKCREGRARKSVKISTLHGQTTPTCQS